MRKINTPTFLTACISMILGLIFQISHRYEDYLISIPFLVIGGVIFVLVIYKTFKLNDKSKH